MLPPGCHGTSLPASGRELGVARQQVVLVDQDEVSLWSISLLPDGLSITICGFLHAVALSDY